MEYDYRKLSGKIVEKFETQYNFATAMDISERTLSLKINGKVSWKDSEMAKAMSLLGIDVRHISDYFFKPKVHNS